MATNYNNMGCGYHSQGEYGKALDCHLKALDIRRKTLGEKNLFVATSHYNVGLNYMTQGDYDNALEHNQKALDIFLEISGDTSAEVETCYDNMRLLYHIKGDLENTLAISQKYLDLKRKKVGEKHPDTAFAHAFIGGIYFRMDKFAPALESYQKALNIALEINHPSAKHFDETISTILWAAKAKGIELKGFKEFVAPRVFMATTIGKDTPAAAKGMDGTYAVLEFNDWTIDSNESLLLANQAANGQPKTIVVMKAGHISQYHFDNNIGVQFNCVNVGEQEKERIIKAYKNWKASTKR